MPDLFRAPPQALRDRATLALSSVGGLGYLPWAPGTWGTLAGLPLWWAMQGLPLAAYVAWTAAAVAGATWVAGRAERIYGAHDVGHIVIDETVGLLCTAIAVPWRGPEVVAAFVVFRVLDALKPPPIAWFDRQVGGGFGVVVDDVVAGLLGCAALHLAAWAYGSWL